jgi:hypothetical protein
MMLLALLEVMVGFARVLLRRATVSIEDIRMCGLRWFCSSAGIVDYG